MNLQKVSETDRIEDEIRRMSGLIEALTNEVRADSRAENGDTRAMVRNPTCRNILGAIDAWLWETDENHQLTYISPQFNNATGCDPAHFLNKTRLQVSSQNVIDNLSSKKHLQQLERRLEFKNYVYGVQTPENGVKWFNVSGKPRYEIKTSKFLGYWGVGTDCTEQYEATYIEGRRMAELGHALNSLDVSILILDRNYCISYRNERWLALHERLDPQFLSVGTKYEDYIRAAVCEDLFPEAHKNREAFIAERIRQNIDPPSEPFHIQRQNGILLSLKIAQIANGSTLIVSTDVTIWN